MDRYDWRWGRRYGEPPPWWYEREPWYVSHRGAGRPAWPYGADSRPAHVLPWEGSHWGRYPGEWQGYRGRIRRPMPEWGYPETRRGRSYGQDYEPSDSQVRDAVTRALRQDGFIDASAIRVDVKDRVVTLSGEMPGYMEVRYAWDDAWDAPGVRGVVSRLTVRGER